MTDHSNLTPPPPEPIPAEHRQAIRAYLLSHAGDQAVDPHGDRGRRWLVPALAAAAVLAIVGLTAYAVGFGGGVDNGLPEQLGPAGGDSTPAPPASTTSTTATDNSTPPVTTSPPPKSAPTPTTTAPPPITTSPGATTPSTLPPVTYRTPTAAPGTPGPGSVIPTSGPPAPPSSPGPVSCEDEISHVDQPGLRGATVTAERSYGSRTTSLYETASGWIVCDDLSTADGEPPTLFSYHDKSKPYQPNTSTLAISENYVTGSDGATDHLQYIAAGADFDGVQAISYRFPDGHTEDAVVGRNGLWSMTYLPTDGILVDPRTSEVTLDPIQVTVDATGGQTSTFTLRWGLDTCAQLNHGC